MLQAWGCSFGQGGGCNHSTRAGGEVSVVLVRSRWGTRWGPHGVLVGEGARGVLIWHEMAHCSAKVGDTMGMCGVLVDARGVFVPHEMAHCSTKVVDVIIQPGQGERSRGQVFVWPR